jgi:putative DNA methylase
VSAVVSTKSVSISGETSSQVAIEIGFPSVQVSRVAERESWRKEINRPSYHIHKWWATRLGSVFRAMVLGALLPAERGIWPEFYKKHKFSGKVVLDPFMGSGTTLGEALKLGCSVVGCDINPISTFLVQQSLTRVTEKRLRDAFQELQEEVATEIRGYYQTLDRITGESIPVLYYFWVKEAVTPSGERIDLFDRYVFSQNAYPKKKPGAQILCPNCGEVFEGRFDARKSTCPTCSFEFDPQVGTVEGQFVKSTDGTKHKIKDLLPDKKPFSHRLYALLALRSDGTKVYMCPNSSDLALCARAHERLMEEDLQLPAMEVRSGHNTNQARGYNYSKWRDFFNDRQLLCLGLLLKAILKIPDREVQEQFICLFSSTLEFNNLFCSFKGEGTGAVRHMFSNHILKPERTPLENSVWGSEKTSGTFASLFESRLIKAKRYLDDPFEVVVDMDAFGAPSATGKLTASDPIRAPLVSKWNESMRHQQAALILNADGASIPIPDGSVDAVVTDPPYFDFVHYSELSDFFFAWLAPVLAERYVFFAKTDSSHKGDVQQKHPREFARQLGRVFLESNRVLKTDGALLFSFHHSRPEGWAAIYEALASSEFTAIAAHPVHGEIRGSSPKNAATDPISLDAILVCKKIGDYAGDARAPDICRTTLETARELERSGLCLSRSDYFVIAAAFALVALGPARLSFTEVEAELQKLKILSATRFASEESVLA